jgi:hypothetical protein
MTVAANLSSAARRAEANTSVVDQDIETIVCGGDFVGQTPHVIERRGFFAVCFCLGASPGLMR